MTYALLLCYQASREGVTTERKLQSNGRGATPMILRIAWQVGSRAASHSDARHYYTHGHLRSATSAVSALLPICSLLSMG